MHRTAVAPRQHSPVLRTIAVLALLSGVSAATARPAAQQTREFPSTRELGAAAVEFDDGVVHAVAAYYHSQRHHDTPWILVEFGINSQKIVRIHRESIEIERPDGTTVRLATHREWSQDVAQAARLLQEAATTRHPVRTYFREFASFSPLRFFRPPHARGTVLDLADLALDRIFLGDLYFQSPTGAWARGRHVLVVHNAVSTVRLPIDLR